MDGRTDSGVTANDSGNPEDTAGIAGLNNDGDSGTPGEGREADSGIDAILNGAAAARREREEERNARTPSPAGPDSVAPKYTKPPDLDGEDPEPPKRGPRANKKRNGEKIPVTVKMCGAVFALLFGVASIFLVGSRALRLEPEEKKELGEALYETIEELPKEHPVVVIISSVAPWARLGDSSIEIVGKRVDYIRRNRVPKTRAVAAPREFAPTQTVTVMRNGETEQTVAKPQDDVPNFGNPFVDREI